MVTSHHLTIGTLHSNHALPGALRDAQRVWREGTERGLQWQVQQSQLMIDSWIDWEEIEQEDQQESFTLGHSGTWRWQQRSAINWQALWWHQGGQQTSIQGVSHNHSGTVSVDWSPA